MHEDFEYVESLEKEIDELESEKADFSNIYDLLLEECVSKDVICSYLHSLSDLNAHTELQCLYLHKVKECECLAIKLSKQTESVNKEVHNNLLKSFSKLEKHSISLELALQQCKEQMKNNSVCKENGSNVFRKEREQYHEIQDLKAQMQDKNIAISELKKLIENCKGKSVETQFNKPSVVRQPNAQRIPKPSVLGKPTPFSNSPEMRSFQTKQSVNKTNVSDDKDVNGKPSMIDPARLPNTANGCKPKPRNWQESMSSRVSNKDVHLGEHRKQKPFLKFNDLRCPTCKKYLFSANHDECVLEYLSKLNPRASAQNKDAKSHKTTKRYMPIEKTRESKRPERQMPSGHRWVPTGKLFNSCTRKFESEPTHGSNVDIHHIHACKQTLGLSAGTSFNGQKQQRIDLNADALYNEKQENLRQIKPRSSWQRRLIAADQASVFMAMTFEQRSSSLVLHQMTSAHNHSELRIHDHSNEPSSSKLVPKVVPLAVKTATSRQELELLFHHHIAMLRTTGRTPKSLTLEIHHGGWFTPTPSRSYIGGQVSSVNVVDIDEFCLHDLKDMVVKLGYGVEDLIDVKPSSSVEAPIVVECAEDPFEEVHVNMNNFRFTADPKHDTSIGGVDVQDDDLDVIDYDSFGRQQFASKEIVKGKVKKHSVETRRQLILVKNINERVRVRCQGTILALVPYVAIDNNTDKNVFSQIKGGPVIRENNNNGKQNILGKDKTVEGNGKKVNTPKKVDKNSCPWTMLVTYTKECRCEFKIKCRNNLRWGVSKMKAFKAKRIAYDIMTESLTRTFKRVYVCLGALKKGLRACRREILGLDGCFMSVPWPGQILTAVGVDANNGIYPVAYVIVESKSKASWCWFLNLLGEDLGKEANFNYTFISDRQKFKGGVYKEMLWNVAKATSEGEFKKNMGELKSFNSDAYDWLIKIPLEQWSRAYFSGRAKCDLLINNIYEVFDRQLVDGRDQPIITCLEYIREYLMKRIVVVQKVIAKTVGPLTPSVTKMFDAIKKRLLSTMFNGMEVNPCNGRDMWPVVESRTVIIPPLYKPLIGRPLKKRKKSNDEIASQSASSGKLSKKGKSVSCGKCGNVGHNRKGCRGQGGGSSQAGTRKVYGQAVDARKASSQPSAAQSTAKQGPRQGFQGRIAGPTSGSQRKTKKLVDL
ncbi:mutator type transposase [Tanacetum coccineum]